MQIGDIEKLAELAKIELNDNEKQSLLKDLDSILGYVKQIESVEVDVQNSVLNIKNVWREDILEIRDFSYDSIVEQFPDSKDGFLKVKKILYET
jgi:aspartyl-tRNA(Asn)/glutamyl-tRNA(Gln) amidotransferase subunit C